MPKAKRFSHLLAARERKPAPAADPPGWGRGSGHRLCSRWFFRAQRIGLRWLADGSSRAPPAIEYDLGSRDLANRRPIGHSWLSPEYGCFGGVDGRMPRDGGARLHAYERDTTSTKHCPARMRFD